MPDEKLTRDAYRELWMAQRAIVHQVIRDDHPERWTREELERELFDIDPHVVGEAIAWLKCEDVLEGAKLTIVWASRSLRYLDALELISI
jgi:hypothetical protein